MAWEMYDELIEGIPEEVEVVDYGLGLNWSWLSAECGCGLAYTCREGAVKGGRRDLRGKPLRKAASLAKSWNFEDATLGIAALNAWYSQASRLDALSADGLALTYAPEGATHEERRIVDPFHLLRPVMEGWEATHDERASVVVVGHFPHVDELAGFADLTILERNCRNDSDTPDPACEYVLPDADFAFLTGVTIINKTAPRLLELGRSAFVSMVGPSVIPAVPLLDRGADMLAGRVVVDPEKAAFSCASRESFGSSIRPFCLARP